MDKKSRGYFVRLDIIKQNDEVEYIGSIKGTVSSIEGLKWLKNMVKINYDKFY